MWLLSYETFVVTCGISPPLTHLCMFFLIFTGAANDSFLPNALKCCFKARLHRRFLSQQLNATRCNFFRAEVATSCDIIAILLQFVSVNVSTRLLLKQKLCAYCTKR